MVDPMVQQDLVPVISNDVHVYWFVGGFPLVSNTTEVVFPLKLLKSHCDSYVSWIFELEKFTSSDYYIAMGSVKNQHRPSNAVRSSTRKRKFAPRAATMEEA